MLMLFCCLLPRALFESLLLELLVGKHLQGLPLPIAARQHSMLPVAVKSRVLAFCPLSCNKVVFCMGSGL